MRSWSKKRMSLEWLNFAILGFSFFSNYPFLEGLNKYNRPITWFHVSYIISGIFVSHLIKVENRI